MARLNLNFLKKAYPDGYLNMKGASTIDGWICQGDGVWLEYGSACSYASIAVIPFEWRASENSQMGPEDTRINLEQGCFLPNLDPENDPATWICAKKEFAQALGPQFNATALSWEKDRYDRGWWLCRSDIWAVTKATSAYFDVSEEDPVTAFLKARIMYREDQNKSIYAMERGWCGAYSPHSKSLACNLLPGHKGDHAVIAAPGVRGVPDLIWENKGEFI